MGLEATVKYHLRRQLALLACRLQQPQMLYLALTIWQPWE